VLQRKRIAPVAVNGPESTAAALVRHIGLRWKVLTDGTAFVGRASKLHAGTLANLLRDLADDFQGDHGCKVAQRNVMANVFDIARPDAGVVATVEVDHRGDVTMFAGKIRLDIASQVRRREW
jgi:hypothetical protein